jgi:hypothetical protein
VFSLYTSNGVELAGLIFSFAHILSQSGQETGRRTNHVDEERILTISGGECQALGNKNAKGRCDAAIKAAPARSGKRVFTSFYREAL